MSLRDLRTPDLDVTILQIFSSRMLQDILKDVVKGCVLFGFLLLPLLLLKAIPQSKEVFFTLCLLYSVALPTNFIVS